MAINDVTGERVYHVWDILRESGLRTLKPKKQRKLKNLSIYKT